VLFGRLPRSVLAAGIVYAATQPSSAAVRPPKLQYEITTLPNGLTLVLSEDHSTPIVHLQLWYHVGSKNEKQGRTGFAHLFEHLMFKGSKNVQPEAHTSMISSIGGQSNAYTTDDERSSGKRCRRSICRSSSGSKPIAWRRCASTGKRSPTSATWSRKSAACASTISRSAGSTRSSTTRPSPCIRTSTPRFGSMADLEAASVDDVRDFYRTYYVPSNATLVLVGDFDATQATQLVAQYLGRVRRRSARFPATFPRNRRRRRKSASRCASPWPLPAVVVAYHITNDGNPDSYPLHIAAKVLSDGQTSRIYQKLVYDKQMAVAAFGNANLIEDPNLFYAVGIVQPGHSPEDVTKELIAEVERLKTEPISDHELQRAKNQFARDYILSRESNQQKATHLAHAVVIHHDIKTADGEFDIFQNISVADVQRVARTYFRPENRLVLTLLPSGKAGAQ
jgi:zinc protease